MIKIKVFIVKGGLKLLLVIGFLVFLSYPSLNASPSDPSKFCIMLVGAHPDDELWGGGCAFSRYIADYEERGVYVGVTKGEGGNSDPITQAGFKYGQTREAEGRCSSSGENADHRWLGIYDAHVPAYSAVLLERMVRVIREISSISRKLVILTIRFSCLPISVSTPIIPRMTRS